MLTSVLASSTSSKIQERVSQLHSPPRMNSHRLQPFFFQVMHLGALHMQITMLKYHHVYEKH